MHLQLRSHSLRQLVRNYKRLQLEASTEMCDELIKLATVRVPITSQSNTVIYLLNTSTSSSSSTIRNTSYDEDNNMYSV